MPSTEEDYIQNEYYAYNHRLFRLIGLWEYQESSKKLIYVHFINLILILASFEQINAIFMSERELNSIAKLLETTLPTLCSGSCYYNLISNAAIMKKIFYRMRRDWIDLANKPEVIILEKYAKLSRLCTIVIIISCYLYIGFLICPSFLRIIQYIFGVISYNELILPVRIDHLMKNQLSYYIGFCCQCLFICIICTVSIANYSMYIAVVLHSCALFNIIVWRINERFKENRNNNYCDGDKVKLSEENEWVVGIIRFYKYSIEFVDLMKSFYEATHLCEWFLAMLFITIDYFYLFQVFSPDANTTGVLTKLSYVIPSMFLFFAYFYLGQKLIDHSDNVFLTICQIPFYSLSLKSQKILLFFIMETMRIRNLSLKGVIVICHSTFSALLQKSFSFAMMFYNLQ